MLENIFLSNPDSLMEIICLGEKDPKSKLDVVPEDSVVTSDTGLGRQWHIMYSAVFLINCLPSSQVNG